MEDRIARSSEEPSEPRGLAVVALAVVLAITAAWWALALWPTGAAQPEWLARTRAACFGSSPGGLPDTGGWILLIGEPLGMCAMLVALWGRSLRRDLAWIARSRPRRVTATAMALGVVTVVGALGVHVARAWAGTHVTTFDASGAPHRVDLAAPAIPLLDQNGLPTSLTDFPRRTVLLTFAYGHCTTVCPSTVNELRTARRTANRPDIPIVIVTLDPWRDTPDRLPMLARHWGLEPNDRVLSGTVENVQRTLDQLGIGRQRSETTGDIDHAAVAMIMSDRGRITWRVDGFAGRLAAHLN